MIRNTNLLLVSFRLSLTEQDDMVISNCFSFLEKKCKLCIEETETKITFYYVIKGYKIKFKYLKIWE
jgi:hypothetical protein